MACRCGKGCAHDWRVIFHRKDVFYPIVGPRCEDWSRHASLNPGTLEITDALSRDILWPEGTKQ